MNNKEYEIYKKISFIERYEKLSVKFHSENEFKYSNEEVIKIIAKIGYSILYVKKYNFFKFEEKIENYKFYFHFSLKYGLAELIIGTTNLKTDIFITGGSFGNLYEDVKYFETKKELKVYKPSFKNYQDLEEILKEAFSIYEDFKTEVLKIEWE